jgi:hypothetical protein
MRGFYHGGFHDEHDCAAGSFGKAVALDPEEPAVARVSHPLEMSFEKENGV